MAGAGAVGGKEVQQLPSRLQIEIPGEQVDGWPPVAAEVAVGQRLQARVHGSR